VSVWIARFVVAVFLFTYADDLAIPAKVVYSLSEPSKCLAWVIHDEARGEPQKGARAVLDAILTRMKKRNKTACEVIAEPRQFSGYKPYIEFKVDDKMIASYEAIQKLPPVVAGCDYFHARSVSPAWRHKMTPCKQVGNHIFYKEKKHDSKIQKR
jgi:N-acetylmuramoyl-L-alanine amidase